MSEIMTFGHTMFDPLDPDPEKIHITDIAHSLSMLCRANGHFKSFYSVGQHCLNCAMEAKARGYSRRVQLACLLHDAGEAYLSDVTRPVKEELPQYKQIEDPLQAAIWRKFLGSDLTEEENRQVFAIDDDLLDHEFLNLMGVALWEPLPKLASQPEYEFIPFAECAREYCRLFAHLEEA